jgi:hypothetical protein
MPIQIDDATTEALIRELARRRGVTLVEAVREAVAQTMVLDAKQAAAKHANPPSNLANED